MATPSLYPQYNRSKNTRKALMALQGALQGIHADGKLTEQEATYLQAWLAEQPHLPREGDVLDIEDLLIDILSDGTVTAEELADLQQMTADVLQYGDDRAQTETCFVNSFLGFLQGIACDDQLNDKEIQSLQDLVRQSRDLRHHWPVEQVETRLNQIIADEVITDEERQGLLDLVKQVGGNQFFATGYAEAATTQLTPFFGELPSDGLEGKQICFTGTFMAGNRKHVEHQARQLGAIPSKRMNRTTDILVVGGTITADWKYATYGLKIKSAIENRKRGLATVVIDEQTWGQLQQA
ncbi:BRCT domain-containing protein [Ferrimonas marina]|uniref:BRCA1 C Terminus (BRCT) domain-containing protein n=1 Tax=Ferrimonas marina TaxID=299255 RepID=A0A1M5TQE3_9GAMM|nr:BRCT domain-containing protein [Ferrimonas marina]SHH52934.1 hypothetical protein SAMN02745129_2237 [Ferrimonas marina]